ncbi:TspO/MBR family protein [Bacillus sp. GM2]|uniref:TspO/MBR family protein n=1 Tax=Bacillus TaxID=1386 RepID=UPI000951EFAA|nr:tryptophan-rich sensory protein [Bacillus paralicheniformis]MSN99216.1 tryptophan-rich sensory protein [Bacillus paralicheniformis]MSO03224.1 tryptophan-rich sensory protein [Bacillus paralicheniformis]MSO07217.1 tryptophan-rich sensory protein [Bacillus paralicheniformis]MSO11211.1 tryptophan-rich sensory protein [Bacillus paralicheniformis]NJE35704.1 tryptophan-rich sensory protein [Bacillus paralicheniformis]
MRRKKLATAVIVFIATYALFSLAGVLFPVDREWYESLNKPDWTPSGRLIGTIWSVLFAFISLAAALVYAAYDLRKAAASFWIMLIINYLFNQAFSYFQFTEKNVLAAAADSFFVAMTALALALITRRIHKTAAILLVPYVLWSFFATYLAFTIYGMNH